MKRCISILLVFIMCTMSGVTNVRADEKTDITIIDILYEKGIISAEDIERADIVELSSINPVQMYSDNGISDVDSFEGVLLTYEQNDTLQSELLIPYVEDEEGSLVTLSDYQRSLVENRVFEQNMDKIDCCVVRIKVTYDFYPLSNANNYAYAYYRHGYMDVTVQHTNVSADNYISDLEVRYMSRGMELDPNTHASKEFKSVLSTVSLPKITAQNVYAKGSTTEHPYLLRDSGNIATGAAFSAVAYTFSHKGKHYAPTVCVILKDIDNPIMDFIMGIDWEF